MKYLLSFFAVVFSANTLLAQSADIVLQNGQIYTMNESQPWANSIAIRGNKIVAISKDTRIEQDLIDAKTRVIELSGRFVLPGFVDAHTHFASFAAQKADINLMRVKDDRGLIAELRRVTDIVAPGEWVTGGQWEGYKQWLAGWKNLEELNKDRWQPERKTVDSITFENPIFLNSYDRKLYLANTLALRAAGLEKNIVDGMHVDANGLPTGLIDSGSPAIARIRKVIKPKSESRLLNEIKIALKIMAKMGITEIHDMTSPGVMKRYTKLRKQNELTARIWMRPHLVDAERVIRSGGKMGMHPVTGQRDRYLRFGAFKAHFDGLMGSHGALLFKPYFDKPGTYGTYRCCTSLDRSLLKPDLKRFDRLLLHAAKNGFVTNTHAIGTRGISELLDSYQRLEEKLGKPLDRYRVIHAQTIRPADFSRFGKLNLIAEVNPYMIEDDMRWMKNRLGPERVKLAFPLKTLVDHGVKLTFGSDIPGAAGATFTNDPMFVLHTAVNRTRPDGTPKGGWLPGQRISIQEALKAYTINASFAAFDEDVRGTIQIGKLADLVIIDQDLTKIDPTKIIHAKVDLTMVDGKIVYQRNTKEK